MNCSDLKYWRTWAEGLWRTAEEAWLSRDGQDHVYCQQVVVPAIRERLEAWAHGEPFVLADLGAGDGYTTKLLLERSIDLSRQVKRVLLLDRSARELDAARYHLRRREVEVIQGDLLSQGWERLLGRRVGRTGYCAVFVLQELPYLATFLEGLGKAMVNEDIFLGVIVAPSYSEELRRAKALRDLRPAMGRDYDWMWAAEYPISTPTCTLYLPHFQRKLTDYSHLFAQCDLGVDATISLGLKHSAANATTFEGTEYGAGIVGKVSSRLVVARRTLRRNGGRHGRHG